MKKTLLALAAALALATASPALADELTVKTSMTLDRVQSAHAGDAAGLAGELRGLADKADKALAARDLRWDLRGPLEFLRGTFRGEADRALRENAASALDLLFRSAVRADGRCGSSRGSAVTRAPAYGLCDAGEASPVYGQGPWYWSCAGVGGGKTALCDAGASASPAASAPSARSYDGRCGPRDGATDASDLGPASYGLCSTGDVRGFTSVKLSDGSTRWTWGCAGSAYGLTASCGARGKAAGVQGSCGTAAGRSWNSTPTYNLCSQGNATWVAGSGPWTWSCRGQNGGQDAQCQAWKQGRSSCLGNSSFPYGGRSYALPWSSDGARVTADPAYSESITGGKRWWRQEFQCDDGAWSARGLGSSQVACDAGYWSNGSSCVRYATAGSCGWAAGQTYSWTPSAGLCSDGAAGGVATYGSSYSWTCYGLNGGSSTSCSAWRSSPAVEGSCGAADGGSYERAPSYNLCSQGEASWVSWGSNRWTWTCSGQNGGSSASCGAWRSWAPQPGSCGSAQGGTYGSAPTWGLCDAGTATWTSTSDNLWQWTCRMDGGSAAACWAYRSRPSENGSCGSADGETYAQRPTWNLCSSGYPTAVSGVGPWYWTCAGRDGGSSSSCSAYRQSQATNGSCGPSNGGTYSAAPSYGLCSSGVASGVSGVGPWYWTCYGADGGTAASCQADKPAALGNACGPADGQSFRSLDPSSASLCSSGRVASWTATFDASGNPGGWEWSCAGNASGTDRTCRADAVR